MQRRRAATIVCVLALVAACGGGNGGRPAPAAPAAKQHQAAAGDLAIVGATILPMDREGTLTGHTVLVRGASILAVAPEADIDTTAATVVDGRGKWLLPGLADMHVHVQSEADFALFLLAGVTTVRDLFGSPGHLAWRAAIARGELAGPTLIAAGPIIDGEHPFWPSSAVAATPATGRAAVQAQKQAGYDWIKVYNGLSAETYDAIVDEAKRQGLPVGGHVPDAVGIAKAIASGQRSIEHFEGYVPMGGAEVMGDDVVAASARAEMWNVPTLIVMDRFGRLDEPAALAAATRGLDLVSPIIVAAWDPKNDFRLRDATPERFVRIRARNQLRRDLVGRLARAGAKIALGTDTGNPFVVPGYAVDEELVLLIGAGLTPWQALRAATASAAELAGTPGGFGVVAAGARADLILLDRDPLADISAVVDPPVVIARGKLHRHDEMLAAIRASLQPAAAADRYAGLPAIETEGTRLVAAGYDVIFRDQTIGGERAVLSRAADGTRVVRGQAVYEIPKLELIYRATRDSLSMRVDGMAGEIEVGRDGGKVVAVVGDEPRELAVEAGAVVAPQTIAEFFWYAELLADLPVGKARTLTAAEVRVERGVHLVPGRFTFTRRADDAGSRRVYDLTGKNGEFDVTGSLVVDPDGAPHEVTVVVRFGTFVTRRIE